MKFLEKWTHIFLFLQNELYAPVNLVNELGSMVLWNLALFQKTNIIEQMQTVKIIPPIKLLMSNCLGDVKYPESSGE